MTSTSDPTSLSLWLADDRVTSQPEVLRRPAAKRLRDHASGAHGTKHVRPVPARPNVRVDHQGRVVDPDLGTVA